MLRKKWKIWKIYIVLLLCICLTAGCSEKGNETPVEITLIHGWGGTMSTHKTMQEIYDEFSRENPDIILKYIPYSDSSIAIERANDMLAVGKMPDIVSTNGLSYYVKNAVKRGKIMDLMPAIEKDEELKNSIHQSVYESWETAGNHLYTVPDALEVAGYWYNEKYMKEAGIMNEDGTVKEPKTWKEFLQTIQELKTWIDKTGQNISVCSIEQVQMVEYLFPARLANEGEAGMDMLNKPSAHFQVETLMPVMSDLKMIYESSNVVDNIETARQDFVDGKSILYFNGIWENNFLRNGNGWEDVGYSTYPHDDFGDLAYVSASSGYVFALQSDPRKEEACLRFLKYMLSDKVQEKVVAITGQMPSNPNIDLEKIKNESEILAEAIDKVYNADVRIKMIRSIWSEERMDIINSYIGQERFTEEVENMVNELNRST